MKTTLEIPDDIYRQAKIRAAHDNRKLKDLVNEGLQIVLGLSQLGASRSLRRMKKAPITIRKGNKIRSLSNDEMAAILEADGERLP